MTQTKSKFYKILLILYTIISIGSTIYLLMQSDETETENRYRETEQEILQIKKYLKQKDATYEQTIDSLTKKSDSLQSVISITDKRLQYSRTQVKDLSTELNDYVDRFDRDTSLKKNDIAFDSLSGMSRNYLIVSQARDSLCDAANFSLKELVAVKDSVIETDSLLLKDYKSYVEQLLSTSNDLNEKLNKTEKKLKRRTLLGRVLSGGLAIVSGILIYQIIQPH